MAARRRREPLEAAVSSRDYARALLALADLLATSVELSDPGRRAPLAKELRETLRELDSVRVPEVSGVDDLRARRSRSA